MALYDGHHLSTRSWPAGRSHTTTLADGDSSPSRHCRRRDCRAGGDRCCHRPGNIYRSASRSRSGQGFSPGRRHSTHCNLNPRGDRVAVRKLWTYRHRRRRRGQRPYCLGAVRDCEPGLLRPYNPPATARSPSWSRLAALHGPAIVAESSPTTKRRGLQSAPDAIVPHSTHSSATTRGVRRDRTFDDCSRANRRRRVD